MDYPSIVENRKQHKELGELDDAIALIPGVKSEGCFYANYIGNDKGRSVIMFLNIRDQNLLFPIGECLDFRYGGIQFTCTLHISDMYERPFHYILQSIVSDEEALEECTKFAKQIHYILNNKSAMDGFGMTRLFEENEKLDKLENREKQLDNLDI